MYIIKINRHSKIPYIKPEHSDINNQDFIALFCLFFVCFLLVLFLMSMQIFLEKAIIFTNDIRMNI